MRWGTMIAVGLLAAVPRGSLAQDAGALLNCPGIADDRARLACFDAAVKAKPPSEPSVTPIEEATTPTKDIVAAPVPAPTAVPTTYKLIDAEDLYASPNKYEGRPIEVRNMRCYHADKAEYRCVAGGNTLLVVFTSKLTPEPQATAVEDECGEIKKMATSPKCLKHARFVPIKHGSDIVNGYRQRMVIVASSIEVSTPQATRRR